MNTYAFIDLNNLHLGVKQLGWTLDYLRLRRYLKEKYGVVKVFAFLGFVESNQNLYTALQDAGYILVFKEVFLADGKMKGNCDAELVLHAMIEYPKYDYALLVTGDGDFACLARYLREKGKLSRILAPSRRGSSFLLRKAAHNRVDYVEWLREKCSYAPKKKSTP